MASKGFTNISIKDEDVAEIVAIGKVLLNPVGIEATVANSIRAIVKLAKEELEVARG